MGKAGETGGYRRNVEYVRGRRESGDRVGREGLIDGRVRVDCGRGERQQRYGQALVRMWEGRIKIWEKCLEARIY